MKSNFTLILFLFSSLCACAANNDSQSQTSNANVNYNLAVNADTANKVHISNGNSSKSSAPLPGQMMPLPSKKSSGRTNLSGEDAITAANQKASQIPTSSHYINSIMTFDYMPGALYQIYSAPLRVTDVQFQEGEHINSVGAGDTLRWQVSKTFSGAGLTRAEHLLVKPTDEGLTNSLVVTTDKRTYHLMLHSTPNTYMASVAWHYEDGDGMLEKFDDDLAAGNANAEGGVDVSHLDFKIGRAHV
jgi:type IV secretion system protein VirB9